MCSWVESDEKKNTHWVGRFQNSQEPVSYYSTASWMVFVTYVTYPYSTCPDGGG